MALKTRKAELFSSVMDGGNVFGATLEAEDIRELLAQPSHSRADRRAAPTLE